MNWDMLFIIWCYLSFRGFFKEAYFFIDDGVVFLLFKIMFGREVRYKRS